MTIKTGDMVRVMAGKDRGKEGKVLQALPRLGLVVVEGVRSSVRHIKARGNQPGQKVNYQAPVQMANVMVITADTPKAEKPAKAKAKKQTAQANKS